MQTGFHIMTKPIGPICNLDCSYCFYLEKEKLYPGTRQWAMAPEVLERYIQQYIAAQPLDEIHFAWQGGEPTLLGVDFFCSVVALQQQYADGKTIHNALQTNGTVLDDAWCEFLAENHFLVGLSIDGPRELHDSYRVDKGSAPTFDRVMRGLNRLKAHQVDFNTLTVVHRRNSEHPLEVYRFLRETGSGFIQFIPVVERKASSPDADGLVLIQPASDRPAEVTEWSVEPITYGKFLSQIFDEWVKRDVGRVFVQQFDVALESWMGMDPSLCVFRRTCGSALSMEHTGDLYSCDHFVYPENKLGNMRISTSARWSLPTSRKNSAATSSTRCRACAGNATFASPATGSAPSTASSPHRMASPGLNYLCAGYKHFFHHIDPHMQFMAAELRAGRPPAGIMRLLGSSQ